jgi:hypothetical protein
MNEVICNMHQTTVHIKYHSQIISIPALYLEGHRFDS